MDPGEFNTKIQIHTILEGQDGIGGVTRIPKLLKRPWAKKAFLSGKEQNRFATIYATAQYTFTTYYTPKLASVKTKDIITDNNGLKYNILTFYTIPEGNSPELIKFITEVNPDGQN